MNDPIFQLSVRKLYAAYPVFELPIWAGSIITRSSVRRALHRLQFNKRSYERASCADWSATDHVQRIAQLLRYARHDWRSETQTPICIGIHESVVYFVDGEHRFAAAYLAGVPSILAHVEGAVRDTNRLLYRATLPRLTTLTQEDQHALSVSKETCPTTATLTPAGFK